jgi:hypothetical protein
MSTVFIRHTVTDYDAWKAVFDEHESVRREHGLANAGLHRDDEDANTVTILLNADDAARAREFLGSDSLREAMSNAGVVSQPDVWVTNEA